MNWRVAILTASDRGFRGEKEDLCAQVLRELIEEELQGEIVEYRIVPDEMDEISATLIEMAEYFEADLILTTGGVGIDPRDVTPEATRTVIDRVLPGIAEAMRIKVMEQSQKVMLTRCIAGVRGKTLIINLPGHPKGVSEFFQSILAQLPFAMEILSGKLPHAEEQMY